MMKAGLESSSFSPVQEPQALVVAPTRELAVQIFMDARKFAYGTMLKPVVMYGGTSVGYQLKQLQQGCHILVGTPGRLIDFISKGKVSNYLTWPDHGSVLLSVILYSCSLCMGTRWSEYLYIYS